MGDGLDIRAAFGRDDEGDARGGAVDQQGEVEFLVDIGAVLDIEAAHLLAGLAGLHGDQRRAQHFLGVGLDLVERAGEAHAALVAGGGLLELALAAAAGVDLRLHHIDGAGQAARRLARFGRRQRRGAFGDRSAELAQNGFGLIFVDVHRSSILMVAAPRRPPKGAEQRPLRVGCAAGYAKAGSSALLAAISVCTEATDLSNICRSAASSDISRTRSTPFAPMTTGTPT